MKISAVVPTYNTGRILRECLDSLLSQSRSFDEIIMVDDGSTDGTREAIWEYHARYPETFKVIMLDSRVERCVGRNTGWRAARGELVAVIEADSVYDKWWVEKVLECFEDGADAVGDRRAVYSPRTFISRMNDEFLRVRLLESRFKPVSGWVFRKKVLEELGGYDEDMVGYEDIELGKRIKEAGYKLVYQPEAVLYHAGEPSTVGQEMRRSWWFGIRAHKYYRKHPRKIPILNFGLFTLLTVSIFAPAIFLSLLFLVLSIQFLKYIAMGMRPIYAMAETVLSIARYWIFSAAYIISSIDKKRRR